MLSLTRKPKQALLWLSLLAAPAALASESAKFVGKSIDAQRAEAVALADSLWNWAEMGYQEYKSSAAMQSQLKAAGFSVKAGLAGIDTAFVASYGDKGPVIGIMAEMDALPGFSQAAVPEKRAQAGMTSGQACGHHLFGAGSVSAAIAVKQWLAQSGLPGRIRLYGTPAEEGGSGKVYLVRDGQFDDVDIMLHWHPASLNKAPVGTSLANKSAKFRFRGIASHAAAAPEYGRSALDGVEAMNMMVNMMREHIPSKARIHYVITNGGAAPNVVPEFAEVFYYVRSPSAESLVPIWQRVEKIAKAAALGTGTEVDWEVIHGNHSVLPNTALARVMHQSLSQFGGYQYDDKERAFAEKIRATLGQRADKVWGNEAKIAPFSEEISSSGGSTDVGDVSWVVPTVGLRTATWVPGTSAHSWQAVAAGGTSIGHKGMLLAAKSMATTAIELYRQPELIQAAKEEFNERRGKDFKYQALLGDRKPPLDYRVQK
ncbi:MAG: amidohydrolase [Cellvibrionaceae bacterium]|nr:amidohydrolase [Cellvibrionaceae bacterium]MCV6624857.1 amidohydrolase [Cellvibrionaceae bacterium]